LDAVVVVFAIDFVPVIIDEGRVSIEDVSPGARVFDLLLAH